LWRHRLPRDLKVKVFFLFLHLLSLIELKRTENMKKRRRRRRRRRSGKGGGRD